MRRWRLLIGLSVGLSGCCLVRKAPVVPADAGTVPLAASGDGVTLLLHGVLSRERFVVASVEVVGSRLASRSPDPDMFRVVRYSADGTALDTVHSWSPLDTLEWDEAGRRERRVTAAEAKVTIPVPARLGVAAVEAQWPGGPGLGRIEVAAALERFCASSPHNPGCRR